jgi:hypothetical protein
VKRFSKTLGLVCAIAAVLTVVPANAARAATTTVNSRISASTIDVGRSVHITGSVSPAAPRQQVWLQQHYSGRWRNVKAATLNKRSAYDVAVRPAGAGTKEYRVVRLYTAGPTVRVAVYKWHYLSDLNPVASYTWDGYSTHPTSINGTLYVHSTYWYVSTGSFGYVQWNLRRQCTQLRGTVGLTDDSSSNASVDTDISVDGLPPLYEGVLPFGTSTTPSLNIRGALRMQVEGIGLNADSDSEILGLGNMQIRCAW